MSETPPNADVLAPAAPGQRGSGDVIADRRYLFARALLEEEGDGAGAADLARQVLERVPDWAPAWLLLAEAQERAGSRDCAAQACRRALALDPQDRLGASLRLARLGGRDAPRRMSPAYVAALFDDYAPRFERHLTVDLAYRGPQQLVAVLEGLGAVSFERVLDIGCGTGLMAAALKGRTTLIEGCDIAPAMAARSRATGLYARVDVADAEEVLACREPGSVDLVTAADVVVYVGELDPLFRAVARALRPGGFFALTIQTGPEDGFGLGEDLRFRHAPSYVRALGAAHGLPVVARADGVLRTDRGRPVAAAAMACRRARA